MPTALFKYLITLLDYHIKSETTLNQLKSDFSSTNKNYSKIFQLKIQFIMTLELSQVPLLGRF